MPNDLDYVKHMMPPHRDHPWSGFGDLVAEPVGREPQVADGFTEHLDCYAAAAECGTWTTFGVRNQFRFPETDITLCDDYFLPRITSDRRCYLVGLTAIVFSLAVMLAVGAYLVHRGWPRHAASHVAVNDSWCTGFDGLSCKQQDTARE